MEEANGRIDDLFRSLDLRERPEDVAGRIARIGFPGRSVERKMERLAKRSGVSRMSQDFQRGEVDLRPQAALLRLLSPAIEPEGGPESVMRRVSAEIGRQPGQRNFRGQALNSSAREAAGGDLGRLSRRQYNKRFRVTARMERKLLRRERDRERRALVLASKSRLARSIEREAFVADTPTACLVAYFVARCNRRSLFTVGGQDPAFDDLCAAMLRVLEGRSETNWFVLAHVLPDEAVVRRLMPEQRARLLGCCFDTLHAAGQRLDELWRRGGIDRETMRVARGNDSSGWNQAAGAWNRIRDLWLVLCRATEADDLLSGLCPGKVMRLMAADVMAWHETVDGDGGSGGVGHADTRIWNDLPLPWVVLSGHARCGAADVDAACRRAGVDPQATGWLGHRPGRVTSRASATPELVHGIVVHAPDLAAALRAAGVFSGKPLSASASVLGDPRVTRDHLAHIEGQERRRREKG